MHQKGAQCDWYEVQVPGQMQVMHLAQREHARCGRVQGVRRRPTPPRRAMCARAIACEVRDGGPRGELPQTTSMPQWSLVRCCPLILAMVLRGRGRPRRLLRALKLDTIGSVRACMHFADQCSKDATAYLLADALCTSQGRPPDYVPSAIQRRICFTELLCVQRKASPQRDAPACLRYGATMCTAQGCPTPSPARYTGLLARLRWRSPHRPRP